MNNENGCPCDRTCCDDPDPGGLSEMNHACSEDEECYEDEHYMTECFNCGSICNCEV